VLSAQYIYSVKLQIRIYIVPLPLTDTYNY